MKKHSILMARLACVLVAALAPAFARGAESGAGVLARVRAAVGYERLRGRAEGVVAEGAAHYRGLDSKSTFEFTPDGRFRSEIGGPLGRVAGFDGARGWEVDMSGMPHTLELEDLEVAFSDSGSSGFSDPYTAGNVGAGVLRAFRIVFDIGNKRAAFVPLGEFADPASERPRRGDVGIH